MFAAHRILRLLSPLTAGQGVKALVSIGGWTGSLWFSTSFGSAENRTAFLQTCLDLVKEYDLDGLDFEWVYPNCGPEGRC